MRRVFNLYTEQGQHSAAVIGKSVELKAICFLKLIFSSEIVISLFDLLRFCADGLAI